jgi:membrane-associated phospholipid phosphatase
MKLRKLLSLEALSLSLLVGLLASVGALVFFAWLSDEVLEGSTRSFDEVTRAQVHRLAFPALTNTMVTISFFGSTLFLLMATIGVVAWFRWKHWRREALLFTATMIGAAVLNTTLKLAFHRQRPVPYFDLTAPNSFSFPSGHALASFCFYGGLAAILTARVGNSSQRVLMWTVAALSVLLIGFSRIYLGVHFTTDVIAGFTAALIWIVMVRFVELQLALRRERRRNSNARVS